MPHFDNGFLLLTRSPALVSPISVVHYAEYTSEIDLVDQLTDVAAQTQCVVSAGGRFAGSVPFGQAQAPGRGRIRRRRGHHGVSGAELDALSLLIVLGTSALGLTQLIIRI